MAMKFEDLPTAKKGTIGEQIVDDYLRTKGFIPYHCHEDGPHPFDRLIASKDKKTIMIADIKSKPHRWRYPDTGINKKHYEDYKHIQDKYRIRIFIFFVDEKMEEVYGNFLDILDKEIIVVGEKEYAGFKAQYPLEQRDKYGENIRYFPLCAMEKICRLDKVQVKMLCDQATRNPEHEKMYQK